MHTLKSILLTLSILPLIVFGQPFSQKLSLRGGWNTVSFYVDPIENDLQTLFADLIDSERLKGVYTFDGNTSVWQWFRVGHPILPGTLLSVQPMRGYWVELSPGEDVDLWVQGELPEQTSLLLNPGWHFMGFGNMEPVFWKDVFQTIPGSMTSFLLYQAGSDTFCGINNPLCGIDLNGDGLIDSTEWNGVLNAGLRYQGKVVDGKAYWLRVTGQPLLVEPELEVEVEGDIDAFDPQGFGNTWYEPGIDTDINGNGLLDYGITIPGAFDRYGNPIVNTQDTIWFRTPTGAEHKNLIIISQEIRIRNMGGAGVLLYKIETDVPWLSSSNVRLGLISPNDWYVLPGGSGQTVYLHANIIGLEVGEYTGNLTVHSNGGSKTYHLKLTVPPLDGNYVGTINIDIISGKNVVMQEWPFRISLNLGGLSRIHSERSPNFHQDLDLSNSGGLNEFELVVSENINADDPHNPYGKDFMRTITMTGGRFQSEWDDEIEDTIGKQLPITGQYHEVVSGLATNDIVMEGEFMLVPDSNWTAFDEPEVSE